MPPQWRRLDYVELDHPKGSSRGGLFSGSGLVDEADRSQRVQDQVSPFVAHGFRIPVRPCYPIRWRRGTWQFVRGGYLVLNN
jgi:hypothetical protein